MDQIAVYGVFRDAGIEEEKAKAIASTLRREFEQSIDMKQLATKADLQVEIEKAKSEIIKWNVGTILAVAALATAIARLL